MKIVITGGSYGIGLECVHKFLEFGHEVYNIDFVINPTLTAAVEHASKASGEVAYHFIQADVGDYDTLPDIEDVQILINNAGVEHTEHDIQTNLVGLINTTKKYGLQPSIKSILNMSSVSAHTGSEFPEYVASKGGVLSYTKWTAQQIAQYGATCNSLSFGGVSTDINKPVLEDEALWEEIMQVTPLRKWVTPREAAQWIYFMTMINESCTGQDLIIDNGESILTHFVWPEE